MVAKVHKILNVSIHQYLSKEEGRSNVENVSILRKLQCLEELMYSIKQVLEMNTVDWLTRGGLKIDEKINIDIVVLTDPSKYAELKDVKKYLIIAF